MSKCCGRNAVVAIRLYGWILCPISNTEGWRAAFSQVVGCGIRDAGNMQIVVQIARATH